MLLLSSRLPPDRSDVANLIALPGTVCDFSAQPYKIQQSKMVKPNNGYYMVNILLMMIVILWLVMVHNNLLEGWATYPSEKSWSDFVSWDGLWHSQLNGKKHLPNHEKVKTTTTGLVNLEAKNLCLWGCATKREPQPWLATWYLMSPCIHMYI